jgi:hypothetical protein
MKATMEWLSNVSVLLELTLEAVDKFVSQQSLAKETSVLDDKFFLESYLCEVQGEFY